MWYCRNRKQKTVTVLELIIICDEVGLCHNIKWMKGADIEASSLSLRQQYDMTVSQERGKLQISNLTSTFRGSIRIKAHENFWRKGSVGVSRDCPNFLGTPYYLRHGESYGFHILHAHLWAQSEQKPIKNSGKVCSRGRCQGLLKIFRAPIRTAHRAVIFAIAQLSCLAKR